MYCKYCGKPLSDGARFCGFCGKDQEITSHNFIKSDISTPSLIYTIVSFLIQAAIIILSFTDVIKISFGEGYLNQSYLLNVFDMFDGSGYFRQLGSLVSDLMVVSDYAFIAGIMIISSIVLCIIYFLYVLILYIPNVNLKKRCSFGKEHHKYSIIPSLINMFIVTFIIIFIGWKAGDIISVLPSNKMIAIYILSGVQLAINLFFKIHAAKGHNITPNIDKVETDVNEDDFEKQLEMYRKHRVKIICVIELATIFLIIIIYIIHLWSAL